MLSKEECEKRFYGQNLEKQFCAGGDQDDACKGDSGGPAIFNDKLVGIISNGVGCAYGFPENFVKIEAYYDWILSNTGITYD